jgi:hypothetical protein
MQLLRLGLVNHTTLGKTFQKENKDVYIIISMIIDGCEFLICVISLLICVKLNHDVKHNLFKSHKKEGAFFVQIVSDKDIVVVQSRNKLKTNKSSSMVAGSQRTSLITGFSAPKIITDAV